MEAELRINPARKELRVIVEAPARTAEAEALLARLSAGEPESLLGFQGSRAVMLTPADILRFYGEDKEVLAQTAADTFTVRRRLYELEALLAEDRKSTRLNSSH